MTPTTISSWTFSLFILHHLVFMLLWHSRIKWHMKSLFITILVCYSVHYSHSDWFEWWYYNIWNEAETWGFFLTLYLVLTVYHCTDSKQHRPCASLQDVPVHKCKTDIRTGPALPQMKYTMINPPAYISSALASRCPLCSDLAPVGTWVTALCLKPPCEDLSLWHVTLNGGICGLRGENWGEKRKKQENWSILLQVETDEELKGRKKTLNK